MKLRQRLRVALALATCTGWMTPPSLPLMAAENAGGTSLIPDVQLDVAGHLHGRLTNADGRPLARSLVQLRQQSTVVASAATSSTGEFELPAPHGGLFMLAAGGSSQPVRCWTLPAAPPHALPQLHVVQGPVQRGQGCTATSCTGTCGGTCDACTGGGFAGNCLGFLMNPIVVGTAIAAAIAIPLALDNDNAS